jgi:septum site-determining protein MinC
MSSAAVNIKGTRDGLVIIIDPSIEYEEIKKNLLLKMESAKGFFKGAKFAVYEHQKATGRRYEELENICRHYGLVPSPEIIWPPAAKKASGVEHREIVNNPGKSTAMLPVRRSSSLSPEATGEKALIISRTLRSGHKVTTPDSLVIMGDVHAGSEIAAGGSVLISGSCLGTIRAGLSGDINALVLAMHFSPVRLMIGGLQADDTIFDRSIKGPLVACLDKGRIIIKRH